MNQWLQSNWLTIAVVAVAVLVPLVSRYIKVRISDSWTQLQATVESTNVRSEARGKHTATLAEVAYSYSYEGEFYSGFYTREAGTETHAWRMLEPFQKGMPICVRLNPKAPENSIYREDDNLSTVRSS